VAQELALVGVGEPRPCADLPHLPDVVEECGRDEQVAVDGGSVVERQGVADAGHGQRMLDEAAQVCVVVLLRGGRESECLSGVGIGAEHRDEECAQTSIVDGLDDGGEFGIHLSAARGDLGRKRTRSSRSTRRTARSSMRSWR
jgi:hypothetical protein